MADDQQIARASRDVYADVPRGARGQIRLGMQKAADLEQKALDLVLKQLPHTVTATVATPAVRQIAQEIGVSDADALTIVFAAGFVAASLVQNELSPEAFVEASLRAGVLTSEYSQKVLRLAERISESRDSLLRTRRAHRLGTAIFPAFVDYSAVVDVRTNVEGDRVEAAIPVALVHLDTDLEDVELRFQMTKDQLIKLRDDLQDTIREMDIVEGWISSRSPKVG